MFFMGHSVVREYDFLRFFKIQKNATFYVFEV